MSLCGGFALLVIFTPRVSFMMSNLILCPFSLSKYSKQLIYISYTYFPPIFLARKGKWPTYKCGSSNLDGGSRKFYIKLIRRTDVFVICCLFNRSQLVGSLIGCFKCCPASDWLKQCGEFPWPITQRCIFNGICRSLSLVLCSPS